MVKYSGKKVNGVKSDQFCSNGAESLEGYKVLIKNKTYDTNGSSNGSGILDKYSEPDLNCIFKQIVKKYNYNPVKLKEYIGKPNDKQNLTTEKILTKHLHRIKKHQHQQINNHPKQWWGCYPEQEVVIKKFCFQ